MVEIEHHKKLINVLRFAFINLNDPIKVSIDTSIDGDRLRFEIDKTFGATELNLVSFIDLGFDPKRCTEIDYWEIWEDGILNQINRICETFIIITNKLTS